MISTVSDHYERLLCDAAFSSKRTTKKYVDEEVASFLKFAAGLEEWSGVSLDAGKIDVSKDTRSLLKMTNTEVTNHFSRLRSHLYELAEISMKSARCA